MEPLAVKGAVLLWDEIVGQIECWTEHIRREPIKTHGQPSISAASRSKDMATRAYPPGIDQNMWRPEHIRREPIITHGDPSISIAARS